MPLTEQQKAEGWIEHDGGQNPLPRFQVMLRDGRTMLTYGGDMYWPHLGDDAPVGSDIIAYRPEPKP